MQCETCIRGNKKKKEIRQAYFPTEAPESSSNKCETRNAKHSLHDFSSESPKECSLTEISESYEHAKNDGGAYQEKKHNAATSYAKKSSVSRGLLKDSKPCAQNGKFFTNSY
jgi:hypothetical protein